VQPGTVGWAIIGCGRVAERRVAPAIKRASGATLVGFCSRDLARAGAYAGRHEAPRAYATLDEVLQDDAVKAVYLCTPNVLHATQAEACLAAGRHVLVEKPLAVSSEDARRLAAAARRAGRVLGVVHQQRFHPANLHLIRLMDDQKLGKPLIVRMQIGIWYPPTDNWRFDPAMSGGGALMDLGPHAIDLMLQVGGPVAAVSSWTANLHFQGPVEDFCHARLEFVRGGVGLLEVSYCVRAYGGRIEVYGDAGTFIADGSLQQAQLFRSTLRLGESQTPAEVREDYYHDAFVDAIEDFTDAVREGREPTVRAADGQAVIEVIEAAYRSARCGERVRLS